MTKYSSIQVTNKQKEQIKKYGEKSKSYSDILENLMRREDFRIELMRINSRIDMILEKITEITGD